MREVFIIQSANGALGRVTIIRLDPGEELLKSMEYACTQAGINSGVIVAGIGSLNGARFVDPVVLPEKKTGYGYGEPLLLSGPIELVSMNGTVCRDINGTTLFHVHFALSDENGNAYGGHVLEGNIVLLTAEIVIAEVSNIDMSRLYNPDLEVFTLALKKK